MIDTKNRRVVLYQLLLSSAAVKMMREASADELDLTEQSDSPALHLCTALLAHSCYHSIPESKTTIPNSDSG